MEKLLEVRNLTKHFPIKKGLLLKTIGQVKAVDGVSLSIEKGKTLGLVGESGCGKSTLGRTIAQIYPATSGEILFDGQDVTKLSSASLLSFRKKVQMIFQDPYASLDPRMTVSRIISQPLRIHKYGTNEQIQKRTKELMELVGLKQSHLNRYPHEFSGGQRQRIGIARAIALNPELIICDEPVSALDVSIQAQILNLLKDLQKELGLTYLFISHNLAVIEHMCDDVAVMYLGRIVEQARGVDLYRKPLHPYTQCLLKAVPEIGQGRAKVQTVLKGDVPSPINPPTGCHFHPRCVFATQECKQESQDLLTLESNHKVACVLYKNFSTKTGEKNESTKKISQHNSGIVTSTELMGSNTEANK